MKKAQETSPNDERLDAFYAAGNAIPVILAQGLYCFPGEPVPIHDEKVGGFITVGLLTMQSLLAELYRHCADIYAIRDHLKALLEHDQYQIGHHVLLLLHAACRKPVPASMIAIVDREELLNPFFQGVMLALDDWLQTQEALWRREMCYAK